jgi:hypothetical protein
MEEIIKEIPTKSPQENNNIIYNHKDTLKLKKPTKKERQLILYYYGQLRPINQIASELNLDILVVERIVKYQNWKPEYLVRLRKAYSEIVGKPLEKVNNKNIPLIAERIQSMHKFQVYSKISVWKFWFKDLFPFRLYRAIKNGIKTEFKIGYKKANDVATNNITQQDGST